MSFRAYAPPVNFSLSIDVTRYCDDGDGVRFAARALGLCSPKRKSLSEALKMVGDLLYARRGKLASVHASDLSDSAREELSKLFSVLGTIPTADECVEAANE